METSTFGAEFCAMKIGVEMIEGLCNKLRMFDIPLDGPCPESTLRKKHHSIAYHKCRESVACGKIQVAKQGTEKNLADLFTKLMTSARRQFLLDCFTY